MKLTLEDVRSMKYFWEKSQDIDRYSKYIYLDLHRDAPEIAKAWHDYLEAERAMSIALAHRESLFEQEEE